MSSDYSTGVPIKKRRYPVIRPPSPPTEEQSFHTVVNDPLHSFRTVFNDSLHKEDSSPSQRAVLLNASIGSSSSGISNAKKDSQHDERKGNFDAMNVYVVPSKPNDSRVKIEEPNPTISCVSRADVDNKGKPAAEKSANCMFSSAKTELNLAPIENKEKPAAAEKPANCLLNSAKTELNLAPIEAPSLHTRMDISSVRKVDEKSKLGLTKTSEITELWLGLKEHLDLAMGGQVEGSHQDQQSREPISLNLSLSKRESSNRCKANDVKLNSDEASKRANRSNWDLNTTMDSWDGSGNEAVGQVTYGFNRIGETQDIKPLICSVGIVGNGVTSKEQPLEKNKSRSNDTISPTLSAKPCNSADNLHLALSPTFLLPHLGEEPSNLSAISNSSSVMANLRLRKAFPLTGNLNNVNIRNVKSEPIDESMTQDVKGVKAVPKGILDSGAVKCESIDRCNPKALRLSNFSAPQKVVDPRSVKPEPVHESIHETLKKIEETSNQSDKPMLQTHNVTEQVTSLADPSVSGDISNCVEHSSNCKVSHLSGEVPWEKSESSVHVAAETTSTFVCHDDYESNVSGMIDTAVAVEKDVDDTEQCGSKFMDEVPHDSQGTGEGSVSDEEKINFSEDSYGSDYESDGNHNVTPAVDAERDGGQEKDFEDGEVRDSMVDVATEGLICEKQIDFAGLPGDNNPTSCVEGKDIATQEPDKTINDNQNANMNYDKKEFAETAYDEKANKNYDKKEAMGESSAVEKSIDGADKKQCIKAPLRHSIVMLGRKDGLKAKETEQPFDQAANASQGSSVTVAQGSDENVKQTDVQKDDSALPMAEASFNVDDTAKDANSEGNKSRIINLPRTSNMSFPSKSRIISGRSFPSRAGRGRFDVTLEEDILRPRERDEIYTDSSLKFSRERYHYQPTRNPRLNFVRGRGRISSRMDTLHGNWDSEFYCGPPEFRAPRHKYAAEADHKFNSYNVGMNGTFAGRGGRKLLNGEGPVFHHLPRSRRRSPGVREGPPGCGIEMVGRVTRNVSPGRCIGEDGSELVGQRNGEKFMKGLHNDSSDPMYTHPHPHPHPQPHPQSSYEGIDGPFARGNRNFLPLQRRGPPRIRSKSPIGSRTRSPGTWSPPRRRSPDGFGGHPELPNQRSPPIYRMERMRSPDDSCFPGQMVVRGHGAAYLSRPSNELRDIDSGRDIGHHRSIVPNRSPSGRVLLGNNRRFDITDPHDRTDVDVYFGRPMQSGRFQELAADGTREERRRFGERRGPLRPFRPPYNGAEGGEFPPNPEGGLGPFRLCPNNDSEFHDRGSLREREFDRRMKNRPGNAPRKARNIEEQDGNYQHGGQVWHDNGFDDMARIKRKRF